MTSNDNCSACTGTTAEICGQFYETYVDRARGFGDNMHESVEEYFPEGGVSPERRERAELHRIDLAERIRSSAEGALISALGDIGCTDTRDMIENKFSAALQAG